MLYYNYQKYRSRIESTNSFINVVNNIFYSLYNDYNTRFNSIESVINSNESRMKFLLSLLNESKKGTLNEDTDRLLDFNQQFLMDFIKGKAEMKFEIPDHIIKDKFENCIIPTNDDYKMLFNLLNLINIAFKNNYENKQMVLEMPDDSFDQRIKYNVEIKKKNLPHLCGITESMQANKPNLLYKLYCTLNPLNNTTSDFWDWILSSEGRQIILDNNTKLWDFIEKDKTKNPSSYIKKGNNLYFKNSQSLTSFKNRYYNYLQKIYPDTENIMDKYPMLKFSRYMAHCSNFLNFVDMNSIYGCIVDYTARENDDHLDQDFWLVNSFPKQVSNKTHEYNVFVQNVLDNFKKYINGDKSAEKWLKDHHVDEKGHHIDIPDCVKDYLDFEKIYSQFSPDLPYLVIPFGDISSYMYTLAGKNGFKSEIHLIGNKTEDEAMQRKSELDDYQTNYTHTDTSISVTVPEFVEKYQKDGRFCYINKIKSENGEIMRLSTCNEEVAFLGLEGNIKSARKLANLANKLTNTFNKRINWNYSLKDFEANDYYLLKKLIDYNFDMENNMLMDNTICLFNNYNREKVAMYLNYEHPLYSVALDYIRQKKYWL